MKIQILFLLIALFSLAPIFAQAGIFDAAQASKCETYEDDEDCPRGGSDDDEPTRPQDPNDPVNPPSDGL